MNKWISILGGLLILQLVVAVALNLGEEDYGAFRPQEKLLAVGGMTVDGLRIEDGENAVVLVRRDGKWRLPELGDFPADQAAVARLLDRLSGLEKGWPVATTAGAARRFRVDDGAFERRLTLSAGGETAAELLVGNSPGFRKVHARPAGEEAIFAVAFNTWEAGATADAWIDKDYLVLDKGEVTRIELPGVVLQRDGDALKVADLDAGEETNAQEADALLDRVASLRIDGVLGADAEPDERHDQPALEVGVGQEGGDELVYRFSKPEDESYYLLRRSDSDRYFKVAEFTVDAIRESTREKLVRSESAGTPTDDLEAAGKAGSVSTGALPSASHLSE